MVATRLVPVLAVAAVLAAVLLYRAPFSKVTEIPDSDGADSIRFQSICGGK